MVVGLGVTLAVYKPRNEKGKILRENQTETYVYYKSHKCHGGIIAVIFKIV